MDISECNIIINAYTHATINLSTLIYYILYLRIILFQNIMYEYQYILIIWLTMFICIGNTRETQILKKYEPARIWTQELLITSQMLYQLSHRSQVEEEHFIDNVSYLGKSWVYLLKLLILNCTWLVNWKDKKRWKYVV